MSGADPVVVCRVLDVEIKEEVNTGASTYIARPSHLITQEKNHPTELHYHSPQLDESPIIGSQLIVTIGAWRESASPLRHCT